MHWQQTTLHVKSTCVHLAPWILFIWQYFRFLIVHSISGSFYESLLLTSQKFSHPVALPGHKWMQMDLIFLGLEFNQPPSYCTWSHSFKRSWIKALSKLFECSQKSFSGNYLLILWTLTSLSLSLSLSLSPCSPSPCLSKASSTPSSTAGPEKTSSRPFAPHRAAQIQPPPHPKSLPTSKRCQLAHPWTTTP